MNTHDFDKATIWLPFTTAWNDLFDGWKEGNLITERGQLGKYLAEKRKLRKYFKRCQNRKTLKLIIISFNCMNKSFFLAYIMHLFSKSSACTIQQMTAKIKNLIMIIYYNVCFVLIWSFPSFCVILYTCCISVFPWIYKDKFYGYQMQSFILHQIFYVIIWINVDIFNNLEENKINVN